MRCKNTKYYWFFIHKNIFLSTKSIRCNFNLKVFLHRLWWQVANLSLPNVLFAHPFLKLFFVISGILCNFAN